VPTQYKVVEISTVTDEEIESVLNEWTGKGWAYDGMQFAMRDSSKRPSMAFVTFTKSSDGE
jgi:hypothetical protein